MVTPDGKKKQHPQQKDETTGSHSIKFHWRVMVLWPFTFEAFLKVSLICLLPPYEEAHAARFTFRSLTEMWNCKYKSIFALDLPSSK